MEVDDILHEDDIRLYLSEVAEVSDSIDTIIICYNTKDLKHCWKGIGKSTEIVGLLETTKYQMLKEGD